MPRRYSDYGDVFYAWNKVSSLGGFITIISVLLFVVILWEAFITQRVVLAHHHSSSQLEFISAQSCPVSYHTCEEAFKVFV
jgi:cytochrome c oxidase subunit 1